MKFVGFDFSIDLIYRIVCLAFLVYIGQPGSLIIKFQANRQMQTDILPVKLVGDYLHVMK